MQLSCHSIETKEGGREERSNLRRHNENDERRDCETCDARQFKESDDQKCITRLSKNTRMDQRRRKTDS